VSYTTPHPCPIFPQSTTACSYGPDEALHRAVLEAMKRNSNNNNNSSSFSFFASATIVITSCAEVTRDRRRVCHRGTFALLHSVMAIPPPPSTISVFLLRLPLPVLESKASRPSYHFPHQSIHAVTVWLRPRTRPTSPELANRSIPLSFTTATCHLFSWSTFVYLSPAHLRILECYDHRPTDHWRTVQ
jgi:hypothetical protein